MSNELTTIRIVSKSSCFVCTFGFVQKCIEYIFKACEFYSSINTHLSTLNKSIQKKSVAHAYGLSKNLVMHIPLYYPNHHYFIHTEPVETSECNTGACEQFDAIARSL